MAKDLKDILTRGVHDITVRKDLERKLASGKKLRIKHGVDPTTNDLHLGYAVVYRKLRAFQELGHTVIFLIGDFTGRFGDPTDKEKSRKMRKRYEVEEAAKSYIKQVSVMLDVNKLEIRSNGEWYDKMSAEELLRLMSEFTVQQMLERDMFEKRLKQGKPIGLHEPVYPVLQAWDSYKLEADATVIGTDQTFNELQARVIQERNRQTPQDVMSIKILVGTDGKQKMSQSLGNDIPITATPEDMYGKIMSIPDSAIADYYELLTDVPLDEINKIVKDAKEVMKHKKKLAKLIVSQFHSPTHAEIAGAIFQTTIQKKETPKDIEVVNFNPKNFQDAVAHLFKLSKSEARRIIEQKGIHVDEKTLVDPLADAPEGIYKKGKRHFVRLKKKK